MIETARRPTRSLLCCVALLVSGLWTGCQAPPRGTLRLTTEPTGASVYIPRMRLQGTTPYEVRGLLEDDRVVIRKPGYAEWTGRVDSLPTAGRGIYKLELRSIR